MSICQHVFDREDGRKIIDRSSAYMVICHGVQARARPADVKCTRCLKVMCSIPICWNFDIAQTCSGKPVFGSEVGKLSGEWCSAGMDGIVRAAALRVAARLRLSF